MHEDFSDRVAKIVDHLVDLSNDAYHEFDAFADDVACSRITDIIEIERTLDSMVVYCFDERILNLYKKILRKLIRQYPDTVECYVDLYYKMYGPDYGLE